MAIPQGFKLWLSKNKNLTIKFFPYISRANKCICDGIKPSCSQSQTNHMVAEGINCCQIEKNCSRILELCNPAWVVPLHIPESATALRCEVIDSGIGPRIISHRYCNQWHSMGSSILWGCQDGISIFWIPGDNVQKF